MKKTEKIEIRMSLEEKKALTRLAEGEGNSVSELVRRLARRYAQMNLPQPRRLNRWGMAGLIACGIGIGSGAAFSFIGASASAPTAKISQLYVQGSVGDSAFGFAVDASGATPPKTLRLDGEAGGYKIDVQLNAAQKAIVTLCFETANGCAPAANAELAYQFTGGTLWQTRTLQGDFVTVGLMPVA